MKRDRVAPLAEEHEKFVILGCITGVSGLQGWVKIQSYTHPRERIFSYDPWYLRQAGRWVEHRARRATSGGKALLAEVNGITDRDAAGEVLRAEIAVRREQLPELAPGEYYQSDLIGMELIDMNGLRFGKLLEIRETGANDVLVVDGVKTILIPMVMGRIVKHIDLENGIIQVDWDPEYQ